MLAASIGFDLARIGFGLALLLAGGAKVAQGRRWTAQASANAIPATVSRVVPWLELAAGAAIVAGVAPPWPSVVGVVLMAAFTAWIVAQLAADRHPPCACFGAWSTTPLSWTHVARNAILIALGVAAAAGS